MTKANTPAPEAKAQTEDPGLPLTAPGAPDQPGADSETVNAPDGTPPSDATQASTEDLAAAAAKAELDASQEDLDAIAAEAAARAATARDLTTIATTISMLNVSGHRLGLVSDLSDQWGAVIVDTEGEGVTVEMQGIKIDPADCLENALTNWANAARRAAAELVG